MGKTMLTVVRKRVGEKAEIVEVEHTLEALQRQVDGYIERLSIGECDILLNEEGKLVGLQPNVEIRLEGGRLDCLCGTLLVVAVRGAEWDSVPESLRAGIMAWLDERAITRQK